MYDFLEKLGSGSVGQGAFFAMFLLLAAIQILRSLFGIIKKDAGWIGRHTSMGALWVSIYIIVLIFSFVISVASVYQLFFYDLSSRAEPKEPVTLKSAYSNDIIYDESDIEDAYYDGYRDGMNDGNDIDSSSSDVDYIVRGVLEEARNYANEASTDITLLDAMDIVSIYLDGNDPSGYPLPTRSEFEKAVDVLLRYAIFLEWNTESYSSIMKDYDPFYG